MEIPVSKLQGGWDMSAQSHESAIPRAPAGKLDVVIQVFNVGAERMLGYAAAEVVDKITPADISDPQEVIARAKALSLELATTITPGFEALVFKASRGIEDIYELTYIRKDGSRFPAVVSVTALRNAQGGIIGYLLIGTDNTARKRAEEALLKAGALQNAILNSANFSIIATDEKGVIQLFNIGAERMLGYTAAEVVNKINPSDIHDPQEVMARAKALSRELATTITPGFEALAFKASRGIEDIYELTYIRKDGSRFPAIVSITALRDDQDGIIGYLLIGSDNTERKSVQEKIKRLTRFHQVLSDINFAIARIRDRTELLQEACRVAVTKEVFKMAWIGTIDPDTLDGTIVAWSGGKKDYVDQLRLTGRAGTPDSDQPACRAVREMKPVICNDVSTDPTVAPLRADLLARGHHSIAAFPLLVEQRAVAVLALFAGEVDFFDREEINLLTELAGDIAFGLEYIAKEKKLDYLAHYDPLTGLPNRMLFYESLKSALAQAEKHRWIVSVLFVDIDR